MRHPGMSYSGAGMSRGRIDSIHRRVLSSSHQKTINARGEDRVDATAVPSGIDTQNQHVKRHAPDPECRPWTTGLDATVVRG